MIMRSKEEISIFEQRLKLAKQQGYITKAEIKTLDADENTILVMSHILFHMGIYIFEESPTEDELTLLRSNQEEEISDDMLKDAEVLCSVDHESGRMTDPIRYTWDEFGAYAHLSNGIIEGPFNSNSGQNTSNKDIEQIKLEMRSAHQNLSVFGKTNSRFVKTEHIDVFSTRIDHK